MTVHITGRLKADPAQSVLPNLTSEERPALRLCLLSDLELDERPLTFGSLPEFDALVLAGGTARGIAEAARLVARAFEGRDESRPVVLVPGVREFADGVPVAENLAHGAEVAAGLGITVLSEGSLRIGPPEGDGVIILGSTLWPNFETAGKDKASLARAHARNRWKACREVMASAEVPMLPHEMVGAHHRGRAFVEDALRSIWAGGETCRRPAVPIVPGVRGGDRAVVVSAFPPTRASLPPTLAKPMFDHWSATWRVSELDELFEAIAAPAAWLHGGVPHAVDLRLGRTRIVANPRGRDPRDGFDPHRVIFV